VDRLETGEDAHRWIHRRSVDRCSYMISDCHGIQISLLLVVVVVVLILLLLVDIRRERIEKERK
jgi:hypothetical protein